MWDGSEAKVASANIAMGSMSTEITSVRESEAKVASADIVIGRLPGPRTSRESRSLSQTLQTLLPTLPAGTCPSTASSRKPRSLPQTFASADIATSTSLPRRRRKPRSLPQTLLLGAVIGASLVRPGMSEAKVTSANIATRCCRGVGRSPITSEAKVTSANIATGAVSCYAMIARSSVLDYGVGSQGHFRRHCYRSPGVGGPNAYGVGSRGRFHRHCYLMAVSFRSYWVVVGSRGRFHRHCYTTKGVSCGLLRRMRWKPRSLPQTLLPAYSDGRARSKEPSWKPRSLPQTLLPERSTFALIVKFVGSRGRFHRHCYAPRRGPHRESDGVGLEAEVASTDIATCQTRRRPLAESNCWKPRSLPQTLLQHPSIQLSFRLLQ